MLVTVRVTGSIELLLPMDNSMLRLRMRQETVMWTKFRRGCTTFHVLPNK